MLLSYNPVSGRSVRATKIPDALKWSTLLFCIFINLNFTFAQLAVTQNSNDTALSQLLAGSGVTISNVTKSCNTLASGTFNNVSSTLGLSQGIVLSTGKVTSIPQPASSFASTALTGAGDPQLSTLTAGPVYDPCILEFDIVPQGDTLQFKYVFASEEYPEFVCSQFNDVFGFFITGPNPAGGNFTNKNIALIPNSTLPVCINAVNDGISGTYNGTTWNSNGCISLSYTADYVNNTTPVSPFIVYNGMTKVLSAISNVVPCQKYHLKIAIADVGDRYYDSGVFLQAYSFSSTPYTIAVTSKVNDTTYASTYEGCVNGTFTVSISNAQSAPVTIALNISGTATNGIDYNTIPDSVTIPAGQTSVTIPFIPVQDNITEGTETATLAVLSQCSGTPITSASLTIMDDPKQALTVSDTTLCAGQSAQLQATGGKSYSWTPTTGLNNSTISNPTATPAVSTTYTANITWGSCVYQLPQTIHVSNPVVNLSATPSDTVCAGANVQLTSTVNAGVAPYNYLWSNGSTASSITSSTSGTFTVSITDNYGCTASAFKNIVQLHPALITTASNINCFGAGTGSVSLIVSGGIVPYSYSWGNGSTTSSLNNIMAGNYTVTATDIKGCSATGSALVLQPSSALVAVATATNNVSCFNGNNGSVNLAVSGGTPTYIFDWAGGVTSQNRSNLIGGNYEVTVTDSKGCTATAAAVITEPAQMLSAGVTTTNINCYDSNTGSIALTVAGGISPYSYNWGGGVTTQNRNNLSAGNYGATVTDANGCTTTVSGAISQPSAGITGSLVGSQISCYGGHNGSVTTTVTGGTFPYYYLWNDGATIPNIANLAAGNYNLTVTDANGCSTTMATNISQPASALTINASAENISCFGLNNGSINITASGGTPVYTYNWTGGVTTQNRTNLGSGTYQLTITDSKGCSATSSATITQPTAAVTAIAIPMAINCYGANTGSVTLSVTGGTTPYTYNWTGGVTAQNRSSLAAGNYTATITDANGCSTIATAVITQPSAALTAVVSTNAVSCYGGNNGNITLNVTGGTSQYSFLWSNGSTTQNLSDLIAGAYAITITDAKGCSVTQSVNVSQPLAGLSLSANATNVSCYNGNNGGINLLVTGGTPAYSYNWNNGSTAQNLSNMPAGGYHVTVTDAKGCSSSVIASITQPLSAISASASPVNISCYGANTGSINLVVTGGSTPYSYNWGGGVTTEDRSDLAAGAYHITVTDANACSVSALVVITQPVAALNATIASLTPVSCYGADNGSLALNVTGGSVPYTFNWNNGYNNQVLSNVAAGTYSVSITDANGCSATASANLSQPASALTANLLPAEINCFGAATGSITTHASGGTAPYVFHWNDGSILQNRSNISAGVYTVVVTDANGCLFSDSVTISQPSNALNGSAAANNVLCFGGTNGAVHVNISGGTAPYVYNWNNGSSTANAMGLAAGIYSVTVKDANSCSVVISATVTAPLSMLSATGNTSNIKCYGASTGSIELQVAGGTLPYYYNWGSGIITAARNNLPAGIYIATVTDANGCTAVVSDTITQPLTAVNATVSKFDIACLGDSTGIMSVTASGGVAPYNFIWNNGSIAAVQNNLLPGNYSVTVTDANACSVTTSGSISQPAQGLKALTAITDPLCYNADNGSIALSVSGGTPPYFFKWNSNSTSQNRTQISAGNYQVTVTDANGCKVTAQSSVSQPAALSVTLNVTPVACFNGANGGISLSASGGTPGYSYNWGNGILSANRSQLSAGNYSVTLTDANACTLSATANIAQPASALAVTSTVNNVSCKGGNNGSIQLSVTGGSAPYSFVWNNGDSMQNRTGLNAGSYLVSVEDSHGCNADASVTILQPAGNLNVSAVGGNVSCFGGNNGFVNVSVAGGTSPYSFSWNTGQRYQNLSGLYAGTYSVVVNDANGCTAGSSSAVSQPNAGLSAAVAVQTVSCFGGNNGVINLTPGGGTGPYSFSWSNGATSQNIQGLSSGIYDVTITDANGCKISNTGNITQPNAAVKADLAITEVSCFAGNNGGIVLSVSGGSAPYTYNWGAGITSQNRNGLSAGNYAVTITDANSCSLVEATAIMQPALAISIVPAITNVNCNGGNSGGISLNVTGGSAPYSYDWNGGQASAIRSNLSAGIYAVTVTDNKGCTAISRDTVQQPQNAIAISVNVTEQVSCYNGDNGAVQLTVTGGTSPYAYIWPGGATSANRSNLSFGTYSVTVTDSHGCSAIASATVTQPATALAVAAQVTNIACYGASDGSVIINATGGTSPYTYSWGNGVTTENRNNLNAGNYPFTVTDSKGCTVSLSATVIQANSSLTVNEEVNAPVCFGGTNGSVKVNATGGTAPYTFTWNGGYNTQNRNNLVAGNYTVTATDANGCTAAAYVQITAPDSLTLATSQSSPTCYGAGNGVISASASGGTPGYRFIWNSGFTGNEITNASAGTYDVTVTDLNGCSAIANDIVMDQPARISLAVNVLSGACAGTNGGRLSALVSGGVAPYQYSWSNSGVNADLTNLLPGNYIVTVTDANQCKQVASAVIADLPGVSAYGLTFALPCQNAKGEVQLYVTSGTGPYAYKWSNGDTSEDLINVHPGNYGVTVVDANGCAFDTSFEIDNLNNFSVRASGGGTINLGGTSELHVSSTGSTQATYSWIPATGLSCISCANTLSQPAETITYTVIGTDSNGCTASDTVSVIVIEDYTIFTPNAFTPNGDGNNDYFQIFGNLAGIHSVDIKIFDRWGEKVFESENPDFKWDGTYKGVLEAPQVFAYEMKIVFQDGHSDVLKKGSITLIR